MTSIGQGGLRISRFYTDGKTNPLGNVKYEKRNTKIQRGDGSVVYELNDYDCPDFWSQNAGDIASSKYFVKGGIGGDKNKRETSVRAMIHRVTNTITTFGFSFGYFESENDSKAFYDELAYILVHQIAAFNSPVWFNYGLKHEYGIVRKGNGWIWNQDNLASEKAATRYGRPAGSACFIQKLNDSLNSIFDTVKNESIIFSNGAGSGCNYSALRGDREKLSLGGTSSGLLSFLKVFDAAAGATKSGGVNRRAARMVCVDIDHPEIESIIGWKSREEKKAKILIAAGFPNDYNGEAYATVSAQNANNSIRVTNAFMKAVESNGDWWTTMRTTVERDRKYSAKKLWMDIAQATWECGDPGVQYHDTINEWNTVPNFGAITASNPCSEFMHPPDTACNLSSHNLRKFDDGKVFDVNAFKHVNEIMTLAKEIIVGASAYPTPAIAENSYKLRPLGIGYANLGALLMQRGLAYDSDDGRLLAALITSAMSGFSYAMSAKIAAAKGSFEHFKANQAPMMSVMQRHKNAAIALNHDVFADLYEASKDAWVEAVKLGREYGYRNSQISVIAPTGTISFLMDADTSGIEPDYALAKDKLLAGGGWMKIVNQTVPHALQARGYSHKEVEKIVSYIESTGGVSGCEYLRPEDISIFDCAQASGRDGRFIAPIAHLKMMEAVQPFLSGAISKTVNCPSSTTAEEIADLYYQGWRRGLKAIAIYRDGSKGSQPLMVGGEKASVTEAPSDSYVAEKPLKEAPKPSLWQNMAIRDEAVATFSPDRPTKLKRAKLPSLRSGVTQKASIGQQKVYFTLNKYPTGELGELFITIGDDGGTTGALAGVLAKCISIGLQHGVPVDEYIQAMAGTKFEPDGIVTGVDGVKFSTSITDLLAKVIAANVGKLEDYSIPPPPKTPSVDSEPVKQSLSTRGPDCTACGGKTYRKGACYTCEKCFTQGGCG